MSVAGWFRSLFRRRPFRNPVRWPGRDGRAVEETDIVAAIAALDKEQAMHDWIHRLGLPVRGCGCPLCFIRRRARGARGN